MQNNDSTICSGLQDIGNFKVGQVWPLYSPADPTKLEAIGASVDAPDGTVPVVLDIRGNMLHQLLSQIPSCRAPDTASTSFDTDIIAQALKSEKKGIILPSTGAYELGGGQWVFAAGEEVIGESNGYDVDVHPDAAAIRLACDDKSNDKEAVDRLITAVGEHPDTVWPVFAYTLISALRPQIMGLGLTSFPVLNIVGPQNYGKSRLNLTYNQLYDQLGSGPGSNDVWGLLNCNSTSLGIQKALSENRGLVLTLDELPLSSEKSVVDRYKKAVAQALRFAANGSERQTAAKGKAEKCQSGMAFTGEMPMTAASDLTRMIVVPVTKPMTGGQASDRANAAGAFRAWLCWLMPRLDAELERLKEQLAMLSGGETARTDTTKVLLKWATESFFRMSCEMDVTDERFSRTAVLNLGENIDELLDAQERQVSQVRVPPPGGNMAWYILKAYRKNDFSIVSSRKELRNDTDCIIEGDALCIRVDTLLAYLRTQPIYRTLTKKQMTKRLSEEGVLSEHAEKRSAAKKIHGKRYLSLSFEALKAAAKQYI